MTLAQWGNLAAAFFGLVGTLILFFNSYSFQGYQQGMHFASPETKPNNDKIRLRNGSRARWQKVGISFLFLSFLLQGFSVFL